METNRDLDGLDSFSRSRALALTNAVSALEFLGEPMPLERLKLIAGIGNHQFDRDERHRMIFEVGFWPNHPVKARSDETIVATLVITCADKAHGLTFESSYISHPWDGDHDVTVGFPMADERERHVVLDCAGRGVGHPHYWTKQEDELRDYRQPIALRLQ